MQQDNAKYSRRLEEKKQAVKMTKKEGLKVKGAESRAQQPRKGPKKQRRHKRQKNRKQRK